MNKINKMRRTMSENNKSNNNAQKYSKHKSGQYQVRNRSVRVYKTKRPVAKIGRPPRKPKQ